MSVRQLRELTCDCRDQRCTHGAPLDGRCVAAISDYADTNAEIRQIGADQGWSESNPGAWNLRDYCPICSKHREVVAVVPGEVRT